MNQFIILFITKNCKAFFRLKASFRQQKQPLCKTAAEV